MTDDWGLGHWRTVKDGDPRAVALFHRHYSCADNMVDHTRYGFSGNGESLILLTADCRALWCWRRVVGEGVVCSVFRNEGPALSSTLIREAVELAWQRWPGERLYTYVNPAKIQSSNPGYSFRCAGWEKVGKSKGGLIILECRP